MLPAHAQQGGAYFADYFRIYSRPRLSSFSVEYGAGSAYYTGDLVRPFNVSAQNYLLNLSFNAGMRYQITDFVSVRGSLNYFRLQATSDRDNDPDFAGRSFKSNNLEASVEVVHDILPKSYTENFVSRFNGYIFAGVGGMRYAPRSTETGQLLPKDPRWSYSNSTVVFPVGFGINFHLFEDSWLGLEAGYRFTRTDFLDNIGYPPFGGPFDGYYIYGFRASIQLYKGYAL